MVLSQKQGKPLTKTEEPEPDINTIPGNEMEKYIPYRISFFEHSLNIWIKVLLVRIIQTITTSLKLNSVALEKSPDIMPILKLDARFVINCAIRFSMSTLSLSLTL